MVSQNYHVRSQLDLTNEIQSCQAVVSQFEKMAEKKAEEIIISTTIVWTENPGNQLCTSN